MSMKRGPENSSRLMMAMVLSAAILLGFDAIGYSLYGKSMLFGGAKPVAAAQAPAATDAAAAPVLAASVSGTQPEAGMRMTMDNGRMAATYAMTGGRLDDVVLAGYGVESAGPKGYPLLQPAGEHAQYVEFGWVGNGIEGPNASSVWQAEADLNGAGKPLVTVWRNATGQVFQRTITLQPDSYMADITDTVMNGATLPVTLTPYGQIHHAGGVLKGEMSTFVNYLGPMGVVADGDDVRVIEEKFDSVKKAGQGEVHSGKNGWWGITSHYFVTAIVPVGDDASDRSVRYASVNGQDFYTASIKRAPVVVAPNATASVSYKVYMGPKQQERLDAAGSHLELAIDWGWFKAIAKPLHTVLVWLHGYVGNWGIAVMLLTLLLKIVTAPLTNRSYRAMAHMKRLAPEIEKLKARHGDDQQQMAMAMMDLYRREKVNPLGGCWPMLVQIPIFFAMYKVVLLAFEFRHAPLGLWIDDMSVMDPYYVLPLLMGASMYIQTKLNPPATDPVQQQVMTMMPIMFTVMFLWFPSGLVLYWLTNNVLTIIQQYWMLRRENALAAAKK